MSKIPQTRSYKLHKVQKILLAEFPFGQLVLELPPLHGTENRLISGSVCRHRARSDHRKTKLFAPSFIKVQSGKHLGIDDFRNGSQRKPPLPPKLVQFLFNISSALYTKKLILLNPPIFYTWQQSIFQISVFQRSIVK